MKFGERQLSARHGGLKAAPTARGGWGVGGGEELAVRDKVNCRPVL